MTMQNYKTIATRFSRKRCSLLGLIVSSLLALSLSAQQAPVNQKAEEQSPASSVRPLPARPAGRPTTLMSDRARQHYQLIWGVDGLDVKAVESGQMIRFSYSVLDPIKAEQLNDKKNNPFLIDEQAGVKLEIPTMEKVGQLRQSTTPEAGRSYWMVFSNKGAVVKPGDRVTIVIGRFKADGLFVR